MTRLIARHLLLNSAKAAAAAPPPEAVVTMESDFVLILAALLCGLICIVGLAAMVRCAWLRQALARSSTSREAAAANTGLKKKVLQALPKYTYSSSPSQHDNNNNNNSNSNNVVVEFACSSTECAICLGDFVEGDQIRVLPQCGHGFHVLCIDTWLGSHSSCPSCRQILVVARCHKCGHGTTSINALNCNNNSTSGNSFLP